MARWEKQGLSRERIVMTALSLLDRAALDGLTMRSLGRELRADPMAIYYYVPNKEALLDAVVEAVWAELRPPPPQPTWRGEVTAIGRAVRDLLRAHPNALPILAARQNLGAAGLDVAERSLQALSDAGLSPARALDMLSVSFSFQIGHALTEAGPSPLDAGAGPESVGATLRGRGEEARYPRLLESLASKRDLRDMDEVWEAGMNALIAGIEALASG